MQILEDLFLTAIFAILCFFFLFGKLGNIHQDGRNQTHYFCGHCCFSLPTCRNNCWRCYKAALAGGPLIVACAVSTSLMHPLDTMKWTGVQPSTLSFPLPVSKHHKLGFTDCTDVLSSNSWTVFKWENGVSTSPKNSIYLIIQ
ncbi:uncharacterized protein [Typha latifolia]|uniref:uncharacterized protein n=1 Tax=Typha latifolia TaxID=4733 RepID=UPI003C2D5FD8